tara:strand:- start:651 stop:1124 length:474 start_codon:yes stop_codon:yes gene_type:complete
MRNPNLDEFVKFWLANFESEVPKIPTNPNELTITAQEKMREWKNGALYQNLFKTSLDSNELPADLQLRLEQNAIWLEDKQRLRDHGWEAKAQEIEAAQQKYENQKLEKEIAESQERQKQQQARVERWKNMSLLERMAAEPLTQDQILRNRKTYGVGQ